jgi:TRAP-type uncharacterized transport system substrate-binding protein
MPQRAQRAYPPGSGIVSRDERSVKTASWTGIGCGAGEITALTVAYATPAQIVVRRDSNIEINVAKRLSIDLHPGAERFFASALTR